MNNVKFESTPQKRKSLIDKRLNLIPRSYKTNYLRATQGTSLRACINAFCLECVYWKTNEVRHCTALSCPLYAVRPYQDLSQNDHEDRDITPESSNTDKDLTSIGESKKEAEKTIKGPTSENRTKLVLEKEV